MELLIAWKKVWTLFMEEIRINLNDANQRLDKFLLKTYPNLSKSLMYKAIRNKKIKVNRKRCEFNQQLKENDTILLFLPPDVLEKKKMEGFEFSNAELNIIYEDENILIVNKPYGLLSQSDSKGNQDCLVKRVQSYLYEKGEYDPKKENSFAPTICHRLDRNTTGLVIAAKNANALREVNRAISERKITKKYRARVSGCFDKKDFSIHAFIRKNGTKALVSDTKKERYVEAFMDCHIEKQYSDFADCIITLHTGRFHQIRALMAHIHHPLIGDIKYGYRGKKENIELQAYQLVFHSIDLPLKINKFTLEKI